MRKLIVVAAAALWACSSDDPSKDPPPDPGPDGTSEATAGTSCRQIRDGYPGSGSGVYWVGPLTCSGDVAQVWCDMDTDGGGWTLVLKLSAGVVGDPYAIWTGSSLNDADPTLLGTGQSASHYLSRIVPEWNSGCGYAFSRAAIRLYTEGVRADKYFVFDTSGTTRESWFSAEKLVSHAYPVNPPDEGDTSGSGGFFSIAGDANFNRRFFVNDVYGGCVNDFGWLVARASGTTPSGTCPWEEPTGGVMIAYAPGDGPTRWASSIKPHVMAIYVR